MIEQKICYKSKPLSILKYLQGLLQVKSSKTKNKTPKIFNLDFIEVLLVKKLLQLFIVEKTKISY